MRTRAWRRQQRDKRIEHWRQILLNSWRVNYRWAPAGEKYPSVRIWASFMMKSHRSGGWPSPRYRDTRHLE